MILSRKGTIFSDAMNKAMRIGNRQNAKKIASAALNEMLRLVCSVR